MTENNQTEKPLPVGWTRTPSGAYVSKGKICVPPNVKMCECPKLLPQDRCSIDNEVCWPLDCQQYYWMKKGEGLNK